MKKTLLLFTVIYFTCNVNCQVKEALDTQVFNRILQKEFYNLLSPQSNNNFGNFASLDLQESEVNFGGSRMFNNGSVLGIKANGGVSDGFLPIFSNNKLNPKMGLDIQFNFLINRHSTMEFPQKNLDEYNANKREINYEYELRQLKIRSNNQRYLLKTTISARDSLINSLSKTLTNFSDTLRLDSLRIVQRKATDELKNYPQPAKETFNLNNWRAEQLKEAENKIKVRGFVAKWISFGYGLNSNGFKLFDGTLAPGSQISKHQSANHTLRTQYNYYNKSDKGLSIFLSAGFSYSIRDNFSDLSKIEINETKNYGTNPGERVVSSKYIAYQGTYNTNLQVASLFGDAYFFLFNQNNTALHIYPAHFFGNNLTPFTNIGLGILQAFKDKTNNIVNAELYANLTDIFNNKASNQNISARSEFGMRFTFPFEFK